MLISLLALLELAWCCKAFCTEVVKSNLSPKWNQSFAMAYFPKSPLSITVYDHDMAGANEPLGQTEIPVSQLQEGSTHIAVYPLRDQSNSQKSCGSVQVGLTLQRLEYAPPPAPAPVPVPVPVPAPAVPGDDELGRVKAELEKALQRNRELEQELTLTKSKLKEASQFEEELARIYQRFHLS